MPRLRFSGFFLGEHVDRFAAVWTCTGRVPGEELAARFARPARLLFRRDDLDALLEAYCERFGDV